MNKQINVGSLWTLLESILTFYRKVSNFLFHFDSKYLHILFYSYEKGEKVTEKILYLIDSDLPILGFIAVYIYVNWIVIPDGVTTGRQFLDVLVNK